MLSDVSPWVVVIVLVSLLFIVVVFNARKDSAIRAASYTLILSILFCYILFNHLVPEIRRFHSLIPADCTVVRPPKIIAFHSKHGLNVSHIVCFGDIGKSIEITNSDGANRGWTPESDETICKTGDKIIDGAEAYVKMEHWYHMDHDERNFTVNRWEEGKKYFCWSDSTIPQYVTFENDQDPSAIGYALACMALIIGLCWASGTFVLLQECFGMAFTDPSFLRIDAYTPTQTLKRMRGEYSDVP